MTTTIITPAAPGAGKHTADTNALIAAVAAAAVNDTIVLGAGTWEIGGVVEDNYTGKMVNTGGSSFLAQNMVDYTPEATTAKQLFIEKALTIEGQKNQADELTTIVTQYNYNGAGVAENTLCCLWWICAPLQKVTIRNLKFHELTSCLYVMTPTDLERIEADSCFSPVWVSMDPRAVYPNFASANSADMTNLPPSAWNNPVTSLWSNLTFTNVSMMHGIGVCETTVRDSHFGPFKSDGTPNLPVSFLYWSAFQIRGSRLAPIWPLITDAQRYTKWVRGVTIYNNHFTNEGGDAMSAAIDITQKLQGCNVDGVTIEANHFEHMEFGDISDRIKFPPTAIGIWAGNGLTGSYIMRDVKVLSNIIDGAEGGRGIIVAGYEPREMGWRSAMEDIWVSGNTFTGFVAGFDGQLAQNALYIESAENTFVVGNHYAACGLPNVEAATGNDNVAIFVNSGSNNNIREAGADFADGYVETNVAINNSQNTRLIGSKNPNYKEKPLGISGACYQYALAALAEKMGE